LLGRYIEGRHYYDTEFRVYAQRQGMKDEGMLVTPGEKTE